MSYAIHISRAHSPISAEEWQSLVKSDPLMRWESNFTVRNPRSGELIQVPGSYGVWARKDAADRLHEVWFSYSRGRISVTDPESDVISRMKEIARQLGAELRGDDGEGY